MISDVDSFVAAIIPSPVVFGKDQTTAESAGIPHSPWYIGGLTGAGAAPTGGLAGSNCVATGGQFVGAIPIPAAVAGSVTRLARLSMLAVAGVGMVRIVDRLWGNVPVVTTTTAQTISQPTLPPRDASASTNGAGVFLSLETSNTTGNIGAISNTTVSYTNSAGVSGRTATLSNYPATAAIGTWVPFSLQSGDVGVRSVQSITLGSSYVSGQVHLVAWRLIAEVAVPANNVAVVVGPNGLGIPAIWDNSVLQLVYWPTAAAIFGLSGSLTYAQG